MNDRSYAVGWGTRCLINANIAQLKGKSGLMWFLVSLLIGPIATLILAAQGRPTVSKPEVE